MSCRLTFCTVCIWCWCRRLTSCLARAEAELHLPHFPAPLSWNKRRAGLQTRLTVCSLRTCSARHSHAVSHDLLPTASSYLHSSSSNSNNNNNNNNNNNRHIHWVLKLCLACLWLDDGIIRIGVYTIINLAANVPPGKERGKFFSPLRGISVT